MLWGTFSVTHIISLILVPGMITALFFILKKAPDKIKTLVLGILSFSGIGAIIFNLAVWGSPLEYLPFHLCSLNAMALPVAVFTRNKTLNNLLLLWSVGACFALVVNFAQADFEIFSWTFFFYYFPHALELGIPILMFLLKLVKKDVKCIWSTLGITLSSYTVIHFINLMINSYTEKNGIVDYAGNIIQVNYMYSIRPENPLLDLFYSIIPHPYWYMYICFAIIAVYLGLVYLNDFIAIAKTKKQAVRQTTE
jgi:uncharacterized membrane protein YwaF